MASKKTTEATDEQRDEGAEHAEQRENGDASTRIDTNDPTLSPTEAVEKALTAKSED